jgi:hypothetical protein
MQCMQIKAQVQFQQAHHQRLLEEARIQGMDLFQSRWQTGQGRGSAGQKITCLGCKEGN